MSSKVKFRSHMNDEFNDAYIMGAVLEWLTWCGQPMVYDGGLCVNRTKEEMEEHAKHPNARLCV